MASPVNSGLSAPSVRVTRMGTPKRLPQECRRRDPCAPGSCPGSRNGHGSRRARNAPFVADMTGIDISDDMLEQAKKNRAENETFEGRYTPASSVPRRNVSISRGQDGVSPNAGSVVGCGSAIACSSQAA